VTFGDIRARWVEGPARSAPRKCIGHYVATIQDQQLVVDIAEVDHPRTPGGIAGQIRNIRIGLDKLIIGLKAIFGDKCRSLIGNDQHVLRGE